MKTINYIKYTSNELTPEYYSMEINKFLEYLQTQCDPIVKYGDFVRQLQSFIPLVVNLDDHSWFVLDFDQNVSDAELFAINKDKAIMKNRKKDEGSKVTDGYSYFNNKSNKIGNEFFNKYFKDLGDKLKNKFTR
jgi:hypothetical protein